MLTMADRHAFMICLAFLLLTSPQAQGARKEEHLAGGKQKQGSRRSPSEEHYVPVRSVVYKSSYSRKPFERFEVCSGCRCCAASNRSNCVGTRCCFSIHCNLPGKPFGVCGFTPRTCGCGSNNCNQPSLPISSAHRVF